MPPDGPILRIDLASTVPVYRQIVDALRALIVEGALQPGESLPTVRELAAQLGVHHNTVAEAYRQLAEEGWLDLARRRGAVVRARSAPRPARDAEGHFTQRLRELIAKARAEGLPPAVINRVLAQFLDAEKESRS